MNPKAKLLVERVLSRARKGSLQEIAGASFVPSKEEQRRAPEPNAAKKWTAAGKSHDAETDSPEGLDASFDVSDNPGIAMRPFPGKDDSYSSYRHVGDDAYVDIVLGGDETDPERAAVAFFVYDNSPTATLFQGVNLEPTMAVEFANELNALSAEENLDAQQVIKLAKGVFKRHNVELIDNSDTLPA